MKCSGVQLTGYYLGEGCGAVAKYEHRGKYYCAAHNTVAKKEPARFKRALRLWERAELRRIRKERAAEALRGSQIDIFEVIT